MPGEVCQVVQMPMELKKPVLGENELVVSVNQCLTGPRIIVSEDAMRTNRY